MRALHDGWTLHQVDGGVSHVPATVPGCVHTDLLAAGLIEDPFLDDNENRLTWIGRSGWDYETVFTWHDDSHERTDLVCEGLDTVATIELNGVAIATTANQHRSYRFSVRELLHEGENTLRVRFASPLAYAEARRAELGDRPGSYPAPYQFIRKMACNFGWDWGPALVTSGIWRPIGLHSWSGARLASVRPLVCTDGPDGRVEVHVTLERTSDAPLTLTAQVAGVVVETVLAAGEREAVLALRVPAPRLWWPRGYGAQDRYDLTVHLSEHTGEPGKAGETGESGATLEEWTGRVGFRDVRLDRTDEGFTVIVNNTPVFVRGVNWIPEDCFPSRLTRERLAERFDQATGANVNLLRVWGGGLYESEDFYDLADELGLLIWQDFPFACAAYPEEEPFSAEVEAEARQNITRLSWRPSLLLWCGNNENLEGHADWGWQDTLGERTWGAGFYHHLLPALMAELDPTRPYWPGSPYSGHPDLAPNDPARGTTHIWDVWNRQDYTHYATYTPRFVAEFGFQGPPAHTTLREAVSGDLTPDAPLVLHHQKAHEGNTKLLRGLGRHLPAPRTYDDWHYLTQLNQARAVTFGIERFRSLAPYCAGTIVWQLNDCWPVTSWSAIDGAGRRKPLWYALRRVYADRLLSIQNNAIAVINDHPQPWRGELELQRLSLTGQPLAKENLAIETAPRSVTTIALPNSVALPADPSAELLSARLEEHRTLHFFAEDTQVAFPAAVYDTEITPAQGGGLDLTVTARTLLRDLALFPDRLDAASFIDDMLITLLPGESVTFHVTGSPDPAALVTHPVLRCVND